MITLQFFAVVAVVGLMGTAYAHTPTSAKSTQTESASKAPSPHEVRPLPSNRAVGASVNRQHELLPYLLFSGLLIAASGADVPQNSAGRKCKRGFQQKAQACVPIEVPENGYLVSSGTRWQCNRGFRVSGQTCVAIRSARSEQSSPGTAGRHR
jgi:hypothetical protein